jgi:hypothetical protein
VLANVPVIMFSHLGREEDKAKAKVFVNTHFMIKGYDSPKSILGRVHELLSDNYPQAPSEDTDLRPSRGLT